MRRKKILFIDKINFIFRKEVKNISLIEVMQLIRLYGMYHGVRLGQIDFFLI